MVKLRLRRVGKKKHPIYKIVATDSRSKRDGAYLETVGRYDPNVHPVLLQMHEEKIFSWLRKGAQPTDTVRSLLRRQGLWMRWALMKQGKDAEVIQKVTERWQLAQVERAKREAERKARRSKRKKKAAAAVKPAEPAAEAVPAAPAAQ
ncbi:MAG TPA: 30S ribosomal protein S16 [Bacteroidota bacterium]|nr:30S ribosomal protein S16 [Bacteroidota bacterium]